MNRLQKRILRNTLLAVIAAIVFGVCGQAKANDASGPVRALVLGAVDSFGVSRAAFLKANTVDGYSCTIQGATVTCRNGDGLSIFGQFEKGKGLTHKGFGFPFSEDECNAIIGSALVTLYDSPDKAEGGRAWWYPTEDVFIAYSTNNACMLSVGIID